MISVIFVPVKACPHWRIVADFGDNLSPKTATVAENGDCRRKVRLSPNSATVAVVSPFSTTVAVFGDSVDRALATWRSPLMRNTHVNQRNS